MQLIALCSGSDGRQTVLETLANVHTYDIGWLASCDAITVVSIYSTIALVSNVT